MVKVERDDFADNLISQAVFDMPLHALMERLAIKDPTRIIDTLGNDGYQLYVVCVDKFTAYMRSLRSPLPYPELVNRLKAICADDKAKAQATAQALGIDLITGKPLLGSGGA